MRYEEHNSGDVNGLGGRWLNGVCLCVMHCLCRSFSLLSINLELTCNCGAGRCDAIRGWDRVKEVKQGEKRTLQRILRGFFGSDPATL